MKNRVSSLYIAALLLLPTLESHSNTCVNLFLLDNSLAKSIDLTLNTSVPLNKHGAFNSRFTASLNHFTQSTSGHFPGNPIVPGAFIQHILFEFAKKQVSTVTEATGLQITNIAKLSFSHPITPSDKITIESKVILINSDQHNLDAKIQSTAFVNGKVAADSLFTISNRLKYVDGTKHILPLVIQDKQSVKQLPQKNEMVLIDTINHKSSNTNPNAVNKDPLKNLSNKTAQSSFRVPANHPFLTVDHRGLQHLPRSLNIEVMAQSAIASLSHDLKKYDFQVLLSKVKNAYIHSQMEAEKDYLIQTKILKINKISGLKNSSGYLVLFKASITQESDLIAEATISGFLKLN